MIDDHMKRSAGYESLASLLAFGGVLMLGFGMFPCLNPIQWQFNFGPGYLPASLFSLVASFPIMWIAWRLSQQSQSIEKEEQMKKQLESSDPKPDDPGQDEDQKPSRITR